MTILFVKENLFSNIVSRQTVVLYLKNNKGVVGGGGGGGKTNPSACIVARFLGHLYQMYTTHADICYFNFSIAVIF